VDDELAGDEPVSDEVRSDARSDHEASDEDEEAPARDAAPRTRGLVASGAQDDAI
jgi:hypothetical protein